MMRSMHRCASNPTPFFRITFPHLHEKLLGMTTMRLPCVEPFGCWRFTMLGFGRANVSYGERSTHLLT